jgi:COP9 signalosome complex subunit 7
LLQIFSFGTYNDYTSTPNLPPLNDSQIQKLRQLSFLTLAKKPADLTYANLLRALSLQTPRELEDLVISAIYAGLLSGTLDPYHQLVSVSSVSPLRDLAPNSIPTMINTLNEWSSRCVSTLADLDRQIANIKADALKRHRDEQEWAAHVEKLVDGKPGEKGNNNEEKVSFGNGSRRLGGGAAAKRGSGMAGLGADDDDGDMDIDDDDDDTGERRGSKASKKRGYGNLSYGK